MQIFSFKHILTASCELKRTHCEQIERSLSALSREPDGRFSHCRSLSAQGEERQEAGVWSRGWTPGSGGVHSKTQYNVYVLTFTWCLGFVVHNTELTASSCSSEQVCRSSVDWLLPATSRWPTTCTKLTSEGFYHYCWSSIGNDIRFLFSFHLLFIL